jgi:hypothetical protein
MRSSRARLLGAALRVVQVLVFLAGSAELVRITLRASGGRKLLWAFNHMEEARFTSMAMLTGTLRYRNGISGITNDDQVFNGAAFTNWGFGVPVLQLPFQAIARHFRATFPNGFFPDRAIFFIYAASLVPVLWWTLDRMLADRRVDASALSWTRRMALSFAATGLVLTYALYQLTAYRFFLYEETIAYLVVVELYAICAYIHVRRSTSLLPVVALAIAAGAGLLIRPTGGGYFGMWLVLLAVARRRKAPVAVFAAVAAPFVAFWLYSNQVRGGSPLALGFSNSVPWFTYHIPMLRWGSQCSDTPEHWYEGARSLFNAFFFAVREVTDPHLLACHFGIELQEASVYANEPFFGAGILALLGWILTHHVLRREKSVAVYLPFAALACLFYSFVKAGMGFGWRYAGDFWPLVVLITLQYVEGLSFRVHRFLGWRMALVLVALAFTGYRKHVTTVLSTIRTLEPINVAAMQERFQSARWGNDPPIPTRVACKDSISWPYRGGAGWSGSCAVDTFTNLYLGVPRKGDRHYELRFDTEQIAVPSVRVFVNGRYYTATKDGSTYHTPIELDSSALAASVVMITVEWTPESSPQGGRLLSAEIA